MRYALWNTLIIILLRFYLCYSIAVNHIILTLTGQLELLLRQGGYWVIAIVSAVEALPLLGSIVPGHTIVILGGFFARLGILNIYGVMAVAAFGAVLGDATSFFVGRKYGMDFIVSWGKFFLIKEEHIERAKGALDRHTGKAIILGRFNPVTRSFIPFLAGAGDIHIRKFWLYDIVGGVMWAVLSVAAGYIFGASYTLVAHAIGRFTAIGIVIAILVAFAYYFINKQRHIFGRYDFHILVVCLISLYLFFQSIEDVIASRPFMAALDVQVNLHMASLHSAPAMPALVGVAEWFSNIISPTILGIGALLLIGGFIHSKRWQNVYISLTAYPIGLLFDLLLKNVVARDRPINMLVPLSDYAFPSGHAVAAGLFFTLIVYFFTRYIKSPTLRELFILGNVIVIVLVCLCRVYLNVHWTSDVIAGSMFGVFWATFSILTVRYIEGLTRGRGAKKLKA